MADIRTFIAINASQRVTNNVARLIPRLESAQAGYRWVEDENLVIQLNSVGMVRDTELPELLKLIKETVEPFPRFELSMQGVSGFPSEEEPRVVWIGVDEGIESLKAIYDTLADALHHWGINRERKPFVPHMTLGRLDRGGRWNDPLLEKMHRLRSHDSGFCTVSEITVYSSYQDRSGLTYTPMARVQLA